ncbi:hypothetical protein K3495_g2528 [Podosphaera aphanis]|nr:hypothetical protein K3495_g2528 [Podosphaera aphanis]
MAGRGRGRGAPGGIKGAPWEYDPTLQLDTEPTELYPSHPNLRKGAPQSREETLQIQYFLKLQEQIHRGPLYTQPSKSVTIAPAKIFSEEQFNQQFNANRKAAMDPFVGVETYSMKYAPKMNDLPKLSDRPFNNEMFPKELWATLEGEDGTAKRKRTTEKKTLILGSMDPNEGDRAKAMLEKLQSLNEDADDAMQEPGEDEDEDDDDKEKDDNSADEDDEFEEDEAADDYNAEQYFDGGEGDSDGDMGGGGDDEY